MSFVLTLISHPAQRVLTPAHAATARDVLSAQGFMAAPPSWLAQDLACDIPFDGNASERDQRNNIVASVLTQFDGEPLDAVIQPLENRRKTLLIADMDSTIIEQECLDELADFAGIKERVSHITRRTMAGELEFEPSLRERVALLKGLDEAVLQRVFDQRITLTSGARDLVGTMRRHGAVTCLVSGGFTFFTDRVAKAAGFEHHKANLLVLEGGRLTGQVAEPILGRTAKCDTLKAYARDRALTRQQTMAVGDGANDVSMIEQAGLGVAFKPHKILADAADAIIVHSDLTALLFLQGYSAEQIEASRSG